VGRAGGVDVGGGGLNRPQNDAVPSPLCLLEHSPREERVVAPQGTPHSHVENTPPRVAIFRGTPSLFTPMARAVLRVSLLPPQQGLQLRDGRCGNSPLLELFIPTVAGELIGSKKKLAYGLQHPPAATSAAATTAFLPPNWYWDRHARMVSVSACVCIPKSTHAHAAPVPLLV